MVFAGFTYTQIILQKNYPTYKIIEHDSVTGRIVSLDKIGKNSIVLILDDITLENENENQTIDSKISLIVFGQSGSFLQNEFYK